MSHGRCVVVLLLFAMVGCASPRGVRIGWIDDAIVYQPSGPYEDDWRPPGLEYEDVTFNSADGTRLHGWFCPAPQPTAVVLYAHGNAGNLEDRWWLAKGLVENCNTSVMLFDYRGYGRSEGSPSERGVIADAKAARAWLASRAGVSEREIVLYGRSLGGGVAVDLAAADGARALVLESTFTSLPDVARGIVPLAPVGALMRNKFKSIDKIAGYQGPLWIAHGDNDNLVPFDHGRKLYAAANDPKNFYRLPGEGHNWKPDDAYYEGLKGFLDTLP